MIGLGMKIYPHEFQLMPFRSKLLKLFSICLAARLATRPGLLLILVVDVELLEDEFLEPAFLAADVIGSLDVAIPRLSLLDGASPKKAPK